MFFEYWMIAILAVWWIASVLHISNIARSEGRVQGITEGTEHTLYILQAKEIIDVDDEGGISKKA